MLQSLSRSSNLDLMVLDDDLVDEQPRISLAESRIFGPEAITEPFRLPNRPSTSAVMRRCVDAQRRAGEFALGLMSASDPH